MFSKGCVLTFWAEATQCLRFGGGYISQSQCALIKILVSEQMGQTHSGGIVSYVGAELLWATMRTVNNMSYIIEMNFSVDNRQLVRPFFSYLQQPLHIPDLFSRHRAVLHVVVDPVQTAKGRLCRLFVDDDLRTKYVINKIFSIICNYRTNLKGCFCY